MCVTGFIRPRGEGVKLRVKEVGRHGRFGAQTSGSFWQPRDMEPMPRRPLSEIHLRVYEPLEAFSADARREWTTYLAGSYPSNAALAASVYEDVVRANAVKNGPRLPQEGPARAYVISFEGQKLICPVQLRFHSIRAAESRPDLFAPTGLAHAAARGLLASLQREVLEKSGIRRLENKCSEGQGARRPQEEPVRLRVALWAASVSWLAIFDPADRVSASSRELIFQTPVCRARARLEAAQNALTIIRGKAVRPSSEISDLREWLAGFHPKSVVELDYGGTVAPLLAAGLLGRDAGGAAYEHGLEELIAANAAAHLGDVESAIASYRQISQRIRRCKMMATAS